MASAPQSFRASRPSARDIVEASLGKVELDAHDAQEKIFSGVYPPDTAARLAECPYSLWMMLMGTLWLAPLLVALLDFDAVSAERGGRSQREEVGL